MPLNKTEIEWCTHTWNPVTGCLHGCEYCYARSVARRFTLNPGDETGNVRVLGEPWLVDNSPGGDFDDAQWIRDPYPFGFDPTFHTYRLQDPIRHKKPAIVFVGSMCDLFGESPLTDCVFTFVGAWIFISRRAHCGYSYQFGPRF